MTFARCALTVRSDIPNWLGVTDDWDDRSDDFRKLNSALPAEEFIQDGRKTTRALPECLFPLAYLSQQLNPVCTLRTSERASNHVYLTEKLKTQPFLENRK